MLRDGIYRVAYPHNRRSKRKQHTALISLRSGAIFGSDEHGGLYQGFQQRLEDGEAAFRVAIQIPPRGQLITGHRARDGPASLEIQTMPGHTGGTEKATVLINSVPVEIEISYLGPLPA